MEKNYKLKSLAVLFVAVLMIAGLSQDVGAAKDNILRIAFDSGDAKSMDPGLSYGTQDVALQDMLYNGLLRYKPGDISEIQPDLAEKYEVAEIDFSNMIRLDPGNSIGYLKRGIARTYIDDFLGACTDWKKAEKLGSKKATEFIIEHCQKLEPK